MKILIIGESCLDVFHYGECHRLCPEAPVPVFNSLRTKINGGMAMNVYKNVLTMTNEVEILTNEDWKKIKKTRFVEEKSNHMFMRLDENDDLYGKKEINKQYLQRFDAIIVSDYNKGFFDNKRYEVYFSKSSFNVFRYKKNTWKVEQVFYIYKD